MRRADHIWLIVLLMAISLTGCRPKGVLSSGEMVDLLYDMHYAEAVIQLAGYNYGHEEAVMKYHYEVLAKHGVTQAQFDSSVVWYTAHPSRYDKIYPRVLARIEKDLDEVARIEAEERGEEGKPRNKLAPLNEVMEAYRVGAKDLWYEEPEPYNPEVPYI